MRPPTFRLPSVPIETPGFDINLPACAHITDRNQIPTGIKSHAADLILGPRTTLPQPRRRRTAEHRNRRHRNPRQTPLMLMTVEHKLRSTLIHDIPKILPAPQTARTLPRQRRMMHHNHPAQTTPPKFDKRLPQTFPLRPANHTPGLKRASRTCRINAHKRHSVPDHHRHPLRLQYLGAKPGPERQPLANMTLRYHRIMISRNQKTLRQPFRPEPVRERHKLALKTKIRHVSNARKNIRPGSNNILHHHISNLAPVMTGSLQNPRRHTQRPLEPYFLQTDRRKDSAIKRQMNVPKLRNTNTLHHFIPCLPNHVISRFFFPTSYSLNPRFTPPALFPLLFPR